MEQTQGRKAQVKAPQMAPPGLPQPPSPDWVYVCFETGSHGPQAGLKLTRAEDNSELLILLSPPVLDRQVCTPPTILPRLSRNAGAGAPIRNTPSPISLSDSGNSPGGQEDPLVQCLHEDQ